MPWLARRSTVSQLSNYVELIKDGCHYHQLFLYDGPLSTPNTTSKVSYLIWYLYKVLNSHTKRQVNRFSLIGQKAFCLWHILQLIRCHHLECTAAHLGTGLRIVTKPVRRLADEIPGSRQAIRARMNCFNIPH